MVAALSVLPFFVLVPLAWLVGPRLRRRGSDGVLALGLLPTEVAAAGLVALAAGDAARTGASLDDALTAVRIAFASERTSGLASP